MLHTLCLTVQASKPSSNMYIKLILFHHYKLTLANFHYADASADGNVSTKYFLLPLCIYVKFKLLNQSNPRTDPIQLEPSRVNPIQFNSVQFNSTELNSYLSPSVRPTHFNPI